MLRCAARRRGAWFRRPCTTRLWLVSTACHWSSRSRSSCPRTEYKFCLALITPLIATKGYTAPELERLFKRALRLSEEIGDTEEILPVLYSRQAYELVGGQFDRAAAHAEEAIRIAELNPLADSAAFAGRLFATLKLFQGEATTACEQLRQMLAQYDPVRHSASALRFGQ